MRIFKQAASAMPKKRRSRYARKKREAFAQKAQRCEAANDSKELARAKNSTKRINILDAQYKNHSASTIATDIKQGPSFGVKARLVKRWRF
jgi:hypothetical protein